VSLWYGQIRPSNYRALCQVYGYLPPWPMGSSPHVDIVHALVDGRDPSKTAFADYLRLTGRPDMLLERVDVLRSLMASTGPLTVDTCCGSVLDGNHRAAVAIVQGREIVRMEHAPYQTISTPHMHIDGRRIDDRWPLDYDFTDKVVLDLGARDGMNAVRALEAGAARCILVDHDYTSLTWHVLDDCGARNRCVVIPADAKELPSQECDVVLAFSVVAHIGTEALARLAHGRDVLLETHGETDGPPDIGHRWQWIREVSYSRTEPTRKRSIYLGTP